LRFLSELREWCGCAPEAWGSRGPGAGGMAGKRGVRRCVKRAGGSVQVCVSSCEGKL